MKRLFFVILLMTLMGSFAFSAESKNDKFVLNTVTNKKITIYGTTKGMEIPSYKGKVVMMEFWGTHCPPCRASIPHYINLMKKYGKSVALLAIEVQDASKSSLAQFVKSKGINYDVVAGSDASDFINYVGQRAQWSGSIPFLMIFDKKGEVVTMQVGMLPESTIERVLKKLIAK